MINMDIERELNISVQEYLRLKFRFMDLIKRYQLKDVIAEKYFTGYNGNLRYIHPHSWIYHSNWVIGQWKDLSYDEMVCYSFYEEHCDELETIYLSNLEPSNDVLIDTEDEDAVTELLTEDGVLYMMDASFIATSFGARAVSETSHTRTEQWLPEYLATEFYNVYSRHGSYSDTLAGEIAQLAAEAVTELLIGEHVYMQEQWSSYRRQIESAALTGISMIDSELQELEYTEYQNRNIVSKVCGDISQLANVEIFFHPHGRSVWRFLYYHHNEDSKLLEMYSLLSMCFRKIRHPELSMNVLHVLSCIDKEQRGVVSDYVNEVYGYRSVISCNDRNSLSIVVSYLDSKTMRETELYLQIILLIIEEVYECYKEQI